MPARNHIDLVEKTMHVLEALGESWGGANLKTIAARTGLVKSSAFRILYTLRELGYAEQAAASGVHRLSPKILMLSRKVAAASSLPEIARPHLVWLRDTVRESVWLGQLRQRQVILVDGVEARHPLQLRYGIGDPCPVHATALGKSIAAHLPPRELNRLLGEGRLRRFTPHTMIRRSSLQMELARVRQNGFAVNDEETTEGAIIFGSPIFDVQRRVFAAVSVTVPTIRCYAQKRKLMIELLKKTSAAITADLATLGFRAPEMEMSSERNAVLNIPSGAASRGR